MKKNATLLELFLIVSLFLSNVEATAKRCSHQKFPANYFQESRVSSCEDHATAEDTFDEILQLIAEKENIPVEAFHALFAEFIAEDALNHRNNDALVEHDQN